MVFFKDKKLYEFSIVELEKKAGWYKTLFYAYIVFAFAIGIVNGYFGVTSLQGVLGGFNGLSMVILLTLVLLSINLLLMIFLWFVVESSYYKMLQLFMEQMSYMKKKWGE